MLFWRYCKDMQTSYFGYFGHAWLYTPKMILSTCRRIWSACQIYTSSFTSFLRYYILKNPAICPELENQNFARYGIGGEISITILASFHFRLFPRKTKYKIFQTVQKTLYKAILSIFCTYLGKNEFSWEKGLCQFFKYSNYLPSCKKSEKTNEPFLKKC